MDGKTTEIFNLRSLTVESKTRTYHGRVGSGGAQRGGRAQQAQQDGTPIGFSAQDTTVHRVLHGIIDNCPEHLSSPKPGHTTGGSGRGARRGGGAGSGRTGCQQNCSPRRQASLVPPKASKTRRLNVSPEARTSEILCKPVEEQNPRLTRG